MGYNLQLVCVCVFLISGCLGFSAEPECTITNYGQVAPAMKKCSTIVFGDLIVPAGKPLKIQPLDNTTIFINGNITFEFTPWVGPLIELNATGLTMIGADGSIFDGNGPRYWDGKGEWGATVKPNFATIQAVNSRFENLIFKNSPKYFLLVDSCTNVVFNEITLDNLDGDEAKAGSNHSGHNTDGFDIQNSTRITVENSRIFNQDDCIAIRWGDYIHVNHLVCRGGHGLSVSVGFSNDSEEINTLSNVLIENSQVLFGRNAIHIKTHVDSGKGIIKNVTYRNIWFEGQKNYGINIQQNYRNQPANGTMPSYAVGNIPINGLRFINVKGLVNSSAVGVYINCADKACQDWEWQNVEVENQKENNCNFTPKGFTC